MMIPKFRAWDKNNNKMIPWRHLLNGHNLRNVFMMTEMCGLELMQSTGLKDKNFVEIYEGDILLHTSSSVNYSDTYWHSYVQVYRMNSGAYRIKGKHIYDTELISARNRLEVVGNIYQNQNLLVKEYFSTSDGIVERADKQ